MSRMTYPLGLIRQDELLRQAADRRRGGELKPRAASNARPQAPQHPLAPSAAPPLGRENSLTLRVAGDGDTAVLARLAALDSSGPPAAPVLLALVDGEPRAALSLSEGTVVADPFRRTAELIEILRRRAEQLDRARRPRRWSRRHAASRRGFRSATEPVLTARVK